MTPAMLRAGVIRGGIGSLSAELDSVCVPLVAEIVVVGGLAVAEAFASCTEVDGWLEEVDEAFS